MKILKNLRKNLIAIFASLLLISLSVTIYHLLPYEKFTIDITTLFGVLISEIITLFGLLFFNTVSNRKKLTIVAGGYTVLLGYQVLAILLSILFAYYYRNATETYKIVLVCLTGLFLVLSVLVYFFGKKVSDKANITNNACLFFKTLEYKISGLKSLKCDKIIFDEIQKIENAVKNCDQSVCVETDELINDCINFLSQQINLKEYNQKVIIETCQKIICLIKQRNAEVCRTKIGGI